MREVDLLKLSTRMFRTRTLRTVLTILGVAVGIGTIVFLVSLGYGLQTLLIENITPSDSLLTLDVFPPGTDQELVGISPSVLARLRDVPNTEEIIGIVIAPGQITHEGIATNGTAMLTEATFFRLSGIKPSYGVLYGYQDARNIVITTTLAQLFEWDAAEAIGKEISLSVFATLDVAPSPPGSNTPTEKEVSGSFIVSGVVSGDLPVFYIDPAALPAFPLSKYSQAKVRVKNADVVDEARTALLDQGFVVFALSDVVEQANKVFKALQIMLAAFGAAALLVSAIGMFNTMTIAFLERTQEIGIMRAIGASERDVFLLFIIESAIMGMLGGTSGITIGFILQQIVNVGVRILAATAGATSVGLFRTPLWFVLFVITFSTLVGLGTGIVPGRRASRLKPLDALKYK